MADLGAEVIKVELAPGGDLMRNYPPIKCEQSGVFVLENRGKQSLCLNLNHLDGVAIVKALAEIIEQWLQSFPTRDEPLAILAEPRVISGAVLDVAKATNHPQMKARHALQEVVHPGIGPLPLPVAPMRFSQAPVAMRGRNPALGEHNETILSQILGFTPERIAALTTSGVLVKKVPVQWDRSE